jgi:hypothetical protein
MVSLVYWMDDVEPQSWEEFIKDPDSTSYSRYIQEKYPERYAEFQVLRALDEAVNGEEDWG